VDPLVVGKVVSGTQGLTGLWRIGGRRDLWRTSDQFKPLKKECCLTSSAPLGPDPSLCFGSRSSS